MTPAPKTSDAVARIQSALDWWQLSGVDHAVSEQPHRWLRPARLVAATSAPANDAAPLPAARYPATLPAYLAWLATGDDLLESDFLEARVMPQAVEDAPLLIMTDQPSPGDAAAGALFAGEEGAFAAAMLRALGLARPQVSLASLLIVRPTGGIIDDARLERAAERARHFLALLRPRALLLLGDRTSRALGQTDAPAGGAFLPFVNLADGTLPVMHAPSLPVLMRHAERKAALWRDLRRLAVAR